MLLSAYAEMDEMKMYCPALGARSFADAETWRGTQRELSSTASHLRLRRAFRPSPFSGWRSPRRVSILGKRPVRVRPRLKSVSSWPRAVAASTVAGPRKPVPPRMRIRFLAGAAVRSGAAARLETKDRRVRDMPYRSMEAPVAALQIAGGMLRL